MRATDVRIGAHPALLQCASRRADEVLPTKRHGGPRIPPISCQLVAVYAASTPGPRSLASEPRISIISSQVEDHWFGEDKQRHFAMSFFVTSFGHAAARMAGLDSDVATLSGVAVAAAAGLGKEIHDRRGGGIFSVKDLVWDAAGIAVGAMLVRQAR